MNIRGNEFAKTGKGAGAEWFERLGYTAEEVGRKLQDPNRFMDELIGKIQQLDRASQTRALDELFGGQGAENLAKMLGLSVAEIQKMRSEAETFSDEQIAAAKKIDSEFATLWRNITVYAKKAAIESVGYAGNIISALRGEWLPGFDEQQKSLAYHSSDEFKLKQAESRRANIQKQIADLEAGPDFATKTLELRQLKASLQAVEEQIISLGGGSDELKSALAELSAITQRAGGSLDGGAASASNFKAALEELKNLVPELKAELDTLGKLAAVDNAFSKAFDKARNLDDLISAGNIAARGRTVARFGAHNNILDLIGAAEGTDKGRGYNETLDYGRWTGGAQNLTSMTLDQIQALQARMRTPENRALYGNGKGSSALGRYQITGQTLKGLMSELGLSGDRLFDEDTQDELARALLRRRGNNPAGLRNEWEGLRGVDDTTIRNAYTGTPTAAQQLAPTDGQQRQIDLTNQQTEARKRLNEAINEGLSRAQFEQSMSGVSAQQRELELAVYDRVAQAKREGIALSDQEIQSIRQRIAATQQLSAQSQQTATSQQQLAQAGEYFGQQFTGALSGLLTGTQDLNSVVRSLINSLIDATLQAALLGEGPLAGLFGGGGSGGGGIFGMIGSFFGMKDGGIVRAAGGGMIRGPGTSTSDSIPAALSDGEFVVNAAATQRNRALLEAVNSGRVAAFRDGGGTDGRTIGGAIGGTVNNFAPSIAINVEGGSRGEVADQALAKKINKEISSAMDAKMAEFAAKHSRNGGMFKQGGF